MNGAGTKIRTRDLLITKQRGQAQLPLMADSRYTPQPELRGRYKSHSSYTPSVIFNNVTCRGRQSLADLLVTLVGKKVGK